MFAPESGLSLSRVDVKVLFKGDTHFPMLIVTLSSPFKHSSLSPFLPSLLTGLAFTDCLSLFSVTTLSQFHV